jgi:hypothetical protein
VDLILRFAGKENERARVRETVYCHLKSRWSEVDHSWLNHRSMASLAYGKCTKAVQSFGKSSNEASRHVLHNQDWNWEVDWKNRQNLL